MLLKLVPIQTRLLQIQDVTGIFMASKKISKKNTQKEMTEDQNGSLHTQKKSTTQKMVVTEEVRQKGIKYT